MLNPEQAKLLAGNLLNEPIEVDVDGLSPETGTPGFDHEPMPDHINGFRIIRPIGRGGMGTIYEAEQEKPLRRVAIKVLRQGVTSRAMLQRFRHEAEILAHLRHPNIAHVYEAGTYDDGTGGRPYFVMEYIPGAMSITRYAETHDLSIRDRLELFLQACDAVAHGHQKSIIHRDLSPSNILVEGEPHPPSSGRGAGGEGDQSPATNEQRQRNPRVKIIDFGIARATDADIAVTTLHTEIGELIGTLQYMSPEQCEGDVHELDIRTDVYSLGVVLYELLTGHLPYDLSHKSLPTATRIIQDTVPPRPSTYARRLRGALDTIITKAIDKDPAKRYQSAADFGRDVRRHLDGDPIDAKAPGVWVRVVKFSVRHPVWTTGLVCLLILISSVSATLLAISILKNVPHSFNVADQGRRLTLLSLGGAPLRVWEIDRHPGGAFIFQEFIRTDAGIRYGVIAINDKGTTENLSRIEVYAPEDLAGEPTWVGHVSQHDVDQLPDANFWPSGFTIGSVEVADIFPDVDGPELIVAHQSHRSLCILRIYSLVDGTVLSEFTHDGNLQSFVWLEKHQQLICAGLNGEAYWAQRGIDKMASGNHPRIILSLTPTRGRITLTAVQSPEGSGLNWYYAIGPPELCDAFGPPALSQPYTGSRDSVDVSLRHNELMSTVQFRVDVTGAVVPGSHLAANKYAEAMLNYALPDPEVFDLMILPPLRTLD